jgi:hypothetical protein
MGQNTDAPVFWIPNTQKQSRQVQHYFKNTNLKAIGKEKQIKGENLCTLTDEPILVLKKG